MRHPTATTAATVAVLGVVALGCGDGDAPISPDPDGLEEPAEAPEGAPDDGLGDAEAERGDGEPAVEGDGEGRLDPESQDE